MVSKVHCPVCGFLMMMEIQGKEVTYTCFNTHPAIGESTGMHLSEEAVEALKSLGPNLDLIMKWVKSG